MDRRQLVVQRAREFFAERLEDVADMVRQDRQELRGWEEPAHVRAVVRRAVHEEGGTQTETAGPALVEAEFGRSAGEPDRGQQREAMGRLLEAGASALDKVRRGPTTPELTAEEELGLECILLLYGRPSLLIANGTLASAPPFWTILEDKREDIEMVQRGVGHIELLGHPEYDWAATGFLVNENTLMTTRRAAELFAENPSGAWQFRPGISAWMDYRSGYQRVASAGYRVRSVVGVHERYDLALLEVDAPHPNGFTPIPLVLAAEALPRLEGRPVYLISYPVRDARRNEPEPIARIFRDVYNVKRVQPGTLRGTLRFQELQLMQHDCGPLGQNTGGCLIDLETHQVLGLHLSGRYLETGTAVPLWMLRDDPLLQRAGVTFAEATAQDRELVADQLDRLARSRYWTEARAVIGNLYQHAFGNGPRP
jgi:hypothetical protein